MSKNSSAAELIVADEATEDLVAAFREEGFDVWQLVLMSIVVDHTFTKNGPAAYQERLKELHMEVSRGRITTTLRNPVFKQACDRLIGDTLDTGMWSVLKNMVNVASDPKDNKNVQAARLLMQLKGMLRTNNEPIHTPETDAFARMVLQAKPGGKVTAVERRLEYEAEGVVDPGASLPETTGGSRETTLDSSGEDYLEAEYELEDG